jgi:hypothetical protein
MKTCTKCGKLKPLDAFYKDARCLDGRYSACKACAKEAAAAWKNANKPSIAEYGRAWRLANPGYAARSAKQWRAENPGKLPEYWAKWNPVCNATRRAAKKAAACDCCVPWTFKFIYAQARALEMHVDHVIPLARGGLHCLRNMQLLSPGENLRKGARLPEAA